MSNNVRTWAIDLILIATFVSLLYGLFLGARPLTPPDEGRYAEIPREMVATGNYTTPHLNGIKYFEKPVLFYWLQSASIKVFGNHEWALRLVTAVMGLLGCLLTYWGARKLYGRRTGILACIVLATSLFYAGLAHFIILDMTLTVFLTGCLLCFLLGTQQAAGQKRNYYLWGMYSFAALATLTKGLIGVILPGMVIFAWLCICNQWPQLKTYCLASGTLLFLGITLPWHILVQLQNPEFLHFYLIEQHFLRYLTDYASRNQPIWFFPVVLLLGFFPWTGFLFPALKFNFPTWQQRKTQTVMIFLLLWASLIFLFYWLSHSQLSPYILPIFPALAIITGRYLDAIWGKYTRGALVAFGLTVFVAIVGCIAAMLYIHHYSGPIIIPQMTIALALGGFLVSTLLAFCYYWRTNLKNGLMTLVLATSFLIVMLNISYGPFETRSIKSLAIQLQSVLKPSDYVIAYNTYYQDLPVYLQRTIRIVNWQGELNFGSQHQDVKNIFMTDQELWQNWHGQQRIFMLLNTKEYDKLKNQPNIKLYLLAKTARNVLVANQDIKS
jgi:4-amino-4-deoxy-L-arabinose transferase-like glycosyltransferase